MRHFGLIHRNVALIVIVALLVATFPASGASASVVLPPATPAQLLSLTSFAFAHSVSRGEWEARKTIAEAVRRSPTDFFLSSDSILWWAVRVSLGIGAALLFPFGLLVQIVTLPIPKGTAPAPHDDWRKPPSWVKRAINTTAEHTLDFMLYEGQLPEETAVRAGALTDEAERIARTLRAFKSFSERETYLRAAGFRSVPTDGPLAAFARSVDGTSLRPALPARAEARLVIFVDPGTADTERTLTRFRPFEEIAGIRNDHIYAMNNAENGRGDICVTGDYARQNGFEIPMAPIAGGVVAKLFRDVTVVVEDGQEKQLFDPNYMDQLVPAMAGAVVAAQSIKDPPYWYVWARDTALLVKFWAHQTIDWDSDRTIAAPLTARMLGKLADYVKFQKNFIRIIADLHARGWRYRTLSEGKVQANGQTLQGRDWSKQKDGPPLKVTALVDIAETFRAVREHDRLMGDIWDVVIANLTYVVKTIHEATTDIWEENFQPSHFYTRLAQYRGLKKGVSFWHSYGRSRPETPEARGIGQQWDTEAEALRERIMRDHVKSIDAVLEELANRTDNPQLKHWVHKHARNAGNPSDFIRELRAALNIPALPEDLLQTNLQAALRDTLRAIPYHFGLKAHHMKSHNADGIDRGAIELYSQLLLLIDFKRHLAETIGWARAGESALIVASVYYDAARRPVTQRAFDSAVIGAVIHNMEETEGTQRIFDADDPAVILTFLAQDYLSRRLFPVNDGRAPDAAVWDTRYPGDIFNGEGFGQGNPWVLTTCWSGRYLFYLSRSLLRHMRAGYPEWISRTQTPDYQNALNLLFAEQRREWPLPLLRQRIELLMKRAIDHVGLVRSSIQKNGDMYEEVDRTTAKPHGARNLAWSFREWNRLLNDWRRTYAVIAHPSELELFIQGMPEDPAHLWRYLAQHRFHPGGDHALRSPIWVGSVGNISLLIRASNEAASVSVNGYTWVDIKRGALLERTTEAPAAVQVLSLVSNGNLQPDEAHDLEHLFIEFVRNPAEGIPLLKQKIDDLQTLPEGSGADFERRAFLADLNHISHYSRETALLNFGIDGIPIAAHLILALRRALGVDTLNDEGVYYWFDDASHAQLDAMRKTMHGWPAGRRLRLQKTSNPAILAMTYGDTASGHSFFIEAIPLLKDYSGKMWGTLAPADTVPLITAGAPHLFTIEDMGRTNGGGAPLVYQTHKPDGEWRDSGIPIGVPREGQSLRMTAENDYPSRLPRRRAAVATAG